MSDSVDYDPFAGGDIRSSHETTEAQKELWLAAQMGHDANCSYNLSVRLDFPVVLDAQKFLRAMEQTATRHAGLRMTFSRDGAFFHVTAESLIDFEEVASGDGDLIARLTKSETETPFDLAAGPLWRCKFVVTGTGTTVLLTMHHIAADGWSTGLILQDLANGYIGSSNGKEGAGYQFEDYARWLNSESVIGQTGADLTYWQGRFATHKSSPSIPSRNERVAMHDFQCHFLSHELSEDCLTQLRKFAKVNKVTLTNLLTTAFAAYLGNISGSDDVVLGIPVAGQLDSGMTDLIGHCVNTLPLKVIVNSTDTFSEVLAKAKNDMLDDFEHRKVTFGTLLKSTSTLRERLDGPLVPIIFNVEPAEFDLRFDDIRPRILFIPRKFDNFDASFNCSVTQSGLCIDVHFSTALYNKEEMQSRLLEFERFLTVVSCCENDGAVVSIPFISESHHVALTRFNATDSEFGKFVSPPAMVEKYATDNPDRTAFLYRDMSISYLELDRRSNGVAAVLTAHGVAKGDLVAIAVPRSLEMILSLLGVLKTGAGYLPIDSDLPPNRIAFMLEDAGVTVVITSEVALESIEQSGMKPLMIEEILDGGNLDYKSATMQPGEIAYVIYTSGSTGEPKGVEVTHGSLWNLLNSLQAEPGFTESDRFIGLTTLSFDIAVLEIWLPIFLGASSVIVDKLDSQDGRTISRIVEDQGVTVVQATPSSWNLLLASNWQGSKKVKAIAGGEPLRPEFIEQLLPKVSEFWNGYGPTEATVYTLFKKVISEDQQIAVGRPVANAKVHIISETGCLLPPEIVGEICISGACLAHGYRHQPQLTSEKFQFHDGLQSLVYHTGDLGYFDAASGDIFCLGRKDDQVKLRGYRIELGEISSIFAKIFSVDQALALIVKDNGNDCIALAYQMVGGKEIGDAQAKEALQEYLPNYMVPIRYIGVDHFSITPNGKIDKRATIKLIAQSQEFAARDGTTREVDERHTEMQELVIGVMQETLQIPILSLHDNFFDVGGHSLVAMNTVIKLGELLDIEIDLVLVFDFPVIGEFSDQIESLLIAEVSAQDKVI